MNALGLKMLLGDRTKFIGLVLGVAFTTFLITFALSYLAGFMTRGLALILDNPQTAVWVMDPAVQSPESTINLPAAALTQIRAVPGVEQAAPLRLGSTTVRFADGRFLEFQLIGVDDATLIGAPHLSDHGEARLRQADAVIADAGGTEGKLHQPCRRADQRPVEGFHLSAPQCPLTAGAELLAVGGDNVHLLKVVAVSHMMPRFPPRPLLYMRLSLLEQIDPGGAQPLTFILVRPRPGVSPAMLADRIERMTGLKALTRDAFIGQTLWWYALNSEDVGDMGSMLLLAVIIGFGLTGILLNLFTLEHLRFYALFKALGASNRVLTRMLLVQVLAIALFAGIVGIGVTAAVGAAVAMLDINYPFRLIWPAPLIALGGGLLIALLSSLWSLRPVWKLAPADILRQ